MWSLWLHWTYHAFQTILPEILQVAAHTHRKPSRTVKWVKKPRNKTKKVIRCKNSMSEAAYLDRVCVCECVWVVLFWMFLREWRKERKSEAIHHATKGNKVASHICVIMKKSRLGFLLIARCVFVRMFYCFFVFAIEWFTEWWLVWILLWNALLELITILMNVSWLSLLTVIASSKQKLWSRCRSRTP